MKNVFKVIGYLFVFIVVIFILFIMEEVIRFNRDGNAKPLIVIREEVPDNYLESVGKIKEKYVGLGYTILYECNVITKDNSDSVQVVIMGGEFRLFGKYLLSAWVQ